MLVVLLSAFILVVAYLCGSLCSAIIVSRLFSLPDPSLEGSKNPGATNVLRLSGKKYAAIVLLGDVLKGVLPVVLARMLGLPETIVGFTCLAAVVGHMYPVFFDFKGGKGVATAIGALLGLHFILGVVVIATWLLVANFSRYSSLASIVAMILAPLYAIVSSRSTDTFIPLLIITVLVLYKHRNNVVRLLDGKEPELKLRHKQLSDLTSDIFAKSIASDEESIGEEVTVQATEETVEPKKARAKPEPKAADKAPAPKKKRKKKDAEAGDKA